MYKILITLALAAAVALTGCVPKPATGTPDQKLPGDDMAQTMPARVGENAIYVPPQKPGTQIYIALAALKNGGYVVIHEDAAGAPGKILGASSLLPAGGSGEFKITINRSSVNGETLHAMLHTDNGDGQFMAATDAPVKNEAGDIIMIGFTIDETATDNPIIAF